MNVIRQYTEVMNGQIVLVKVYQPVRYNTPAYVYPKTFNGGKVSKAYVD